MWIKFYIEPMGTKVKLFDQFSVQISFFSNPPKKTKLYQNPLGGFEEATY
jgi:hypothetical protein